MSAFLETPCALITAITVFFQTQNRPREETCKKHYQEERHFRTESLVQDNKEVHF